MIAVGTAQIIAVLRNEINRQQHLLTGNRHKIQPRAVGSAADFRHRKGLCTRRRKRLDHIAHMKAVFHLGQHAAVPHAKYAADKLPRLRKAFRA